MFVLVPLPRSPVPVAVAVPDEAVRPAPAESPVRKAPQNPRPAVADKTPGARPSPTVPTRPAAPAIDLPGMAALCTDLSRAIDTRALPPALERAAKLLDASGLVIWVADPDGRELLPVMAHGYPPNLISRLGNMSRDAENVTAAAFRTGLVQTVKADKISHGAIAAPLLTPAGPVGVMAAEVLNDGERREATRAAAAIVAAQLATLMGPPAARTQGKTEAV
jgi:GAF domain